MKYLIVLLICLMTLVCFAQEKNEIPITLMLTDGELKVILYYNETVEGFAQQVIEDRARDYMKELVKVHRKEDIEAIIKALKLKPKKPKKWSGLTGFTTGYGEVENYGDTWLANGFTEIRFLRDYMNTADVDASKLAVIAASAKGLKTIWGVSSNSFNNPDYTITSTNWLDFRAAILDAAQWAQDNGVFEFQLGNEEEYHVDGTTMTYEQIRTNIKNVATEVKSIFTNGNISYTTGMGGLVNGWGWPEIGKGDLDFLCVNLYRGGTTFNDDWKTIIDNLITAFGIDGTYITEFNLSYLSLENYSTDEAVQAAGVTEMIEYIKASGMTRALFYCWKDYYDGIFGVVKEDGTYRLLWNSLLNSK